jgi:peptidoglycan/LPS O-acetylase OafA/YrhL
MSVAISGWVKLPSLRGRLVELDVIRGVAIILAMGWHFNGGRVGIAVIDWLLEPGRRIGWCGVDLFFVLSGFLIGGLVFKEYEKTGAFSFQRFLVRRVFKIWPILYSLLLFQIFIVRSHPWQSYLFQCLFHVQNYLPTSLDHLWSVAVEEQFYVIFALLYSLLTRRSSGSSILPWILLVVMGGALLARILATSMGIPARDIQWQTQYRIDGLACGLLLAWIKNFRKEMYDYIASCRVALVPLILIGVSLLWIMPRDGVYMSSIGYTANYLTAAAVILIFSQSAPRHLSLPWRAVAGVGLYSYALYVFQFAAVRPSAMLSAKLHLTGSGGALFIVFADYAAAGCVAVVMTGLVEQPMLRLRDRLFPGLKVVPR